MVKLHGSPLVDLAVFDADGNERRRFDSVHVVAEERNERGVLVVMTGKDSYEYRVRIPSGHSYTLRQV